MFNDNHANGGISEESQELGAMAIASRTNFVNGACNLIAPYSYRAQLLAGSTRDDREERSCSMQQPNIGNMPQNAINPMIMSQMQNCINDCLNCYNVCTDRAMSALADGKANNVTALLDCADICQDAASSMMRRSQLHGYFCNACQAICTHCADVCDRMGDQDCANACRACATSCQQIVKMIA